MNRMNKKGVILPIGTLLVIVLIGVGIWAIATGRLFGGTTQLAAVTPTQLAATGGTGADRLCLVEDTTVTFSNVDAFARATDPAGGHLILEADGQVNIVVNDDAEKTWSPGDSYIVLIGNETTGLTGGTDYYPLVKTDKVPCKGTLTILGDQFKTSGTSGLTFTYWNDNQVPNTAQAMGASATKTVRMRFAVGDNLCYGNPDAGVDNVLCFRSNTTTIESIELVGHSPASTPRSMTAAANREFICFNFPVICDNADWEGKAVIKTTSTEPTSEARIGIRLADATWDFDSDTFALIAGVEDEDRNDIGVADSTYDNVYNISLS